MSDTDRPPSLVLPRCRGRRAIVLGVAVTTLIVLTLLNAPASNAGSAPLSAPAGGAPPVGHVWLIMLENHSWAENFGAPAQQFQPRAGSPESMTYLAKTLPSLGARLDDYYGIAHPSDANYTAWVSGQPPSFGFFSASACPKTGFPSLGVTFCTGSLLDCLYYTPFAQTGTTEDGVAIGRAACTRRTCPTSARRCATRRPR